MFTRIKRKLQINHKANIIAFFSISFLIFFLSFGYSIVQQNLMVAGDVEYDPDACVLSDSWNTILSNVQAGNSIQYSVGCRKDIEMDINNDGVNETYTLRIANNSNPGVCEGQGYSTTSCGFVLEFVDVIGSHSMGSTFSINGWPGSDIRTYLNTTVYNALPTVIKEAIVNTNVVSGGTNGNSNYTSTDKLYLLSAIEVYGSAGYDMVTASYTRQLDYYQIVGVTSSNYTKAIKKIYGIPQNWFLRSQDSQSSSAFLGVDVTGEWRDIATTAVEGVSPAFRINMPSFAADSWDDIVDNIQTGDTHYYHVGDTKTVDLGSLGVHTLRIANMSTPAECLTGSFSETACGFVLEFEDVIMTRSMNSTLTNVGGWSATDMRTYVNDTVYNALPTVLKSAILDTKVISGHGTTTGETNFYSTDKLYLLSSIEVSGTSASVDTLTTSVTRQLDYYFESGVTSSNPSGASKKLNGNANSWWLRSASSSSSSTYGTERFNNVYTDGKATYHAAATSALGVSPAFRLGSSFATDSWETIVANAKSGDTSMYQVGSIKSVDLDTFGTHIIRVANNSTPAVCETEGYSQTACGFVLEFADIITTHAMNSTATNVGGWPESDMRSYLNTTIYDSLPEILRNAILDTMVVSGHGTTSGETNFVSLDKMYLLSSLEVSGTASSIDSLKSSSTRQLDYYGDVANVSTSNYSGAIKKGGTVNTSWSLRSASSSATLTYGTQRFTLVYTGGETNYHGQATNTYGVSPAFRLGEASFENDSWATIVSNIRTGNTDYYHLGDTKDIDMGAFGIHTLRIANISTPSLCNTSGYSQTACGFVLEFVDIITTHNVNSTLTNVGGWPASGLREYVNNDIYNSLPTALADVIINTPVVSGHGTTAGESNFTSTDKLYLLDYVELVGSNHSSITLKTTQTRQLDYYSAQGVTSSNYSELIKKVNGTATSWWMRSASSSSNGTYGAERFFDVYTDGKPTYHTSATSSLGVSLAFRIGQSFETDSWETIINNIDSGNTDIYQVGETKEVDLGSLGVHTLRIANNSTPSSCNSASFSQTACGFVLEFVDIITTHNMNSTAISQGGWPATSMRNYVNDTVYNSLPASLKSRIIDTYVVSGHDVNSSNNYTSVDKLYLLSHVEIYGSNYDTDTLTTTNTRQLDYYNETGTTRSNATAAIKYSGSTALNWWLRSPHSNQSDRFWDVIPSTGAGGTYYANSVYGVSPAFRLGPKNMLMKHTDVSTMTFGKSISRESFESITTVNHINVPVNAIDSWDVSASKNGSIMAWYTDTDNDSKYELYIGQVGGVIANINSNYLFMDFINLDSLDLTHFYTSDVKYMGQMFARAGQNSTTFTLNLGNHFDTSSSTYMFEMFTYVGYSSTSFSLDLGDYFDTSHVTDMKAIFGEVGYSSTSFSLDLGSKFDTSNVTNMYGMFYELGHTSTSFTLDLGDKFDTSKVTNMLGMFYGAAYNASSVTLNLGNKFDTSNVVEMSGMFREFAYNSGSVTLNLGSNFDTSNVVNMEHMFYDTGYSATTFTLNLKNKFDTSKVESMRYMFYRTGYSATTFTLNLGNKFDTSRVESMNHMFYRTGYSNPDFTLDLGDKFVFTNVSDYEYIFNGWKSTQKIYVKSTAEQSWIVNNAGNSNLTVSNVIVKVMLIQQGDDSSITFGKNINRESFESLTAVNYITVPAAAIDSWDVSSNQSGAIMAWYTDADNDSKYELYLGQVGGVVANTNSRDAFSSFDTLDSLDLTYFNTSTVTDMSYMFYGAGYNSTIFTLNLGSNFDTSNVMDMEGMFASVGYNSTVFTLDLGNQFDTSNVMGMSGMFSETGYSSTVFTLDLGSKFDTSNVTNMAVMFSNAGYTNPNFTVNLGNKFNTSNVTDMSWMFNQLGYRSTALTLNLGNQFDTSNVTNMSHMFSNTGYTSPVFTLNLGSLINTSKVEDMSYMFYQTGYASTIFTLNLGSMFDTSKVKNMSAMFRSTGRNNTTFTLDLGSLFDTSKVEDMSYMFYYTGAKSTVFTLDLGNKFNTSNVEDMSYMFGRAGDASTVFTLNLGSLFDTSKVKDMRYMFDYVGYSNTTFTLNLGNQFDTSNVVRMDQMFRAAGYNSTVFTLDLGSKFNTSKVVNMTYMFNQIGRSNPNFTLNLGNQFDTSNVTDMYGMFSLTAYGNSAFTLDLGPSFVFTNVTIYTDIFKSWKTTQKLYVKSTTEQTWIINNSGNSNLTTSNVLIRS